MSQPLDKAAGTTAMDSRITKKMLQALAPLPDTAMRLLALLDDPDVPLRDIANVAVRDVGISATMLRMANSSMFGLRGRVGSISDALRIIGTAQARLLVLASGISQAGAKELPLYGLGSGSFMKHSELVANLAMYVAKEVSYPNMGNAYSAGLLHDIGKIVINGLAQQHGAGSDALTRVMQQQGCTMAEAEREVYGGDHAQIGRQLGELWSLPPDLSQAIALHHAVPPQNAENLLPWCVIIANAVAANADPAYPALDRVEAPAQTLIDLERVYATAEQFVAETSA